MFHIVRPKTSSAPRSRAAFVPGVVAALILAAVPVAQAGSYTDLRSPDARDQARVAQSSPYTDLRSPDARDQARVAQSSPYTDLRSPDARDARHAGSQFASPPSSNSFEARDAALIGGGVLALTLMALVGWLAVSRHGGHIRKSPGTAVSG
jgi:hypothetical protein